MSHRPCLKWIIESGSVGGRERERDSLRPERAKGDCFVDPLRAEPKAEPPDKAKLKLRRKKQKSKKVKREFS